MKLLKALMMVIFNSEDEIADFLAKETLLSFKHQVIP